MEMYMHLDRIQKYFTPTSILDIGANVGDFTRECKLIFPNANYFLVEGNRACESHLKQLGEEYFIGLLSDTEKTARFYIDKSNPISTGNSVYRENTEHFSDENIIIEELQTTTLNSIIQGRSFDLIKLDVQGSELDILRGGTDVVQAAKGIILELSFIDYNQNAASYEEVRDYMESIDYEIVEKLYEHLDPRGIVFQWDALFLNRRFYGI